MLYEQAEKLGFPPVLFVDFRPIEKFPVLFILDNDVAEQVTKPNKAFRTSMPKHPSIQQLAPLVGARSLVTTDVSQLSSIYLAMFRIQKLINICRVTSGLLYTNEYVLASNLAIFLVWLM
jgi:hypothetical protein